MEFIYTNYEELDLKKQIINIFMADKISLYLMPKNKECLFYLGIMFAFGKKIEIINEQELDLSATTKSFSMMPYVWSKIGNSEFPKSDFSDVITEMDKRIENIKRMGVKVESFEDISTNKIFLICPVRNATKEQKEYIENFVKEKESEGIKVHAPHLDTVQTDMFGGYAICKQNAEAVATSKEVDIYYDQSSTGSVFDLGVAYALNKPLILLNKEEIKFNEKDFIDNLVMNWPYKKDKGYQRIR